SSPLLNDNDIRGAKWILININSSEGEHEFTMDEVEIIQNHLLSQAGENTDVILGLGYDNNLGSKIGITLIATGFQYKDPFTKREAPKQEVKTGDDKIVMILGEQPSPKPQAIIPQEPKIEDVLAPKLIDEEAITEIPMPQLKDAQIDLHFDTVNVVEKEEEESAPVHLHLKIKDEKAQADEEKKELEKKKQWLDERFEKLRQSVLASNNNPSKTNQNTSSTSAASGGYLARPSNIYAESKPEVSTSKSAEEPVPAPVAKVDDSEIIDMQLVIRNDIPTAAETPTSHQTHPDNHRESTTQADDLALPDAAEEQKRRAAERLQKLRNLSFNLNAADPNNEFETVPAYIRRNMELFNNSSSVENFYSKYEVKDDGSGKGATISTINTFLDGKKPD
ncbi:MAG TPA: cell division protein FtsZ, partial [Verrucomicrobiae bacterium]|nr:cell division protein FtsZ [Verrucomicrobiae bacterium]